MGNSVSRSSTESYKECNLTKGPDLTEVVWIWFYEVNAYMPFESIRNKMCYFVVYCEDDDDDNDDDDADEDADKMVSIRTVMFVLL